MVLAGDIGGTNSRLALFEARAGGRPEAVAERTYPSRDHDGLGAIVLLFRKEFPQPIEAASFGVAGPVVAGWSRTTNLPWEIEARALARVLSLRACFLLNDLEATGWGVRALGPGDTAVLQAGAPDAEGNSAIIAAGTGLGEAGLFRDAGGFVPFATEGGHADFGPRDEVEDDLLIALRARHGRVSWERVVSGPGLVAIYEFLRDRGGRKEDPEVALAMRGGDPGAAVSSAGLAGRDPLAREALDRFVSLYGAEAGNLALKMLARGGVFVAGGIAPRILERLESGIFMNAFLDKGRMRPVLEAMPVRVVTHDGVGLLGAALHALEHR
jgi:glucokinase